jgi:DNA-binding transcriptional regulator YdaS (Cro superfamily)
MLKAFLRSLPDDAARREWAISCGTSLGHLRNSIYQPKPLSAETCVLIEQQSAGQVRRWHLRPDDWHRIWPELITHPGAPIVGHRHQSVAPDVQGVRDAA